MLILSFNYFAFRKQTATIASWTTNKPLRIKILQYFLIKFSLSQGKKRIWAIIHADQNGRWNAVGPTTNFYLICGREL